MSETILAGGTFDEGRFTDAVERLAELSGISVIPRPLAPTPAQIAADEREDALQPLIEKYLRDLSFICEAFSEMSVLDLLYIGVAAADRTNETIGDALIGLKVRRALRAYATQVAELHAG